MTNSFEFSEWKVEFESLRVRLVIIYRMPYSQAHPVTPKVFFQELSSYLEFDDSGTGVACTDRGF